MQQTFPEIYKRDSKGKLRVWFMEQDGDRYRTFDGLKDGTVKSSEWRVAQPTNVGRSNERDGVAQATFEIESAYENKLTREYHRTIEATEGGAHFFKPMLAAKYEGFEPGFAQPKLDGIRAIVTKDGVFSRQGKPIPGAPHILEALAGVFAKAPDLILDGELYNHALKDDFNELVSLIKKAAPSPEREAEIREKVQYHIYDCPKPLPFGPRSNFVSALVTAINHPAIVAVPTVAVHSEGDFDTHHGAWLTEGYEGSMWRCPTTPYEQKRSKSLRKRKDFDDAEFEIVRIEEGEGNWSGAAKRVVCWLPGADRSAGPNDTNTFEAGLRGTYAANQALLADAANQRVVTIRYFGFTPSAVPKPRFGVATQFHGKERTL